MQAFSVRTYAFDHKVSVFIPLLRLLEAAATVVEKNRGMKPDITLCKPQRHFTQVLCPIARKYKWQCILTHSRESECIQGIIENYRCLCKPFRRLFHGAEVS